MTTAWGVPGSIICIREEVYKQNINRKITERKWQLLEFYLEGNPTASSGQSVRTRSWTPWSRRKWQRVPLDFWQSSLISKLQNNYVIDKMTKDYSSSRLTDISGSMERTRKQHQRMMLQMKMICTGRWEIQFFQLLSVQT